MRIAMVIPTIRKFDGWNTFQNEIDTSNHKVDVFTCGEEKDVNPHIDKVLFSSPKWREMEFGKKNLWLFPKFTRHVNSIYAYILKEKLKYDMIVTVDDDVKCDDGFFDKHEYALNQLTFPKYESVFNSSEIFPRGFPYHQRGKGRERVLFNQGLWSIIPDLNACDYPIENDVQTRLKFGYNVAQPGKGITVSSMNVAFKPECLPIYYQPVNFTRHDDIWAGLILKRILDAHRYYLGYGNPIVMHMKYPRNIWEDNKKEANGHEINEQLWDELQKIDLSKSTSFIDSYSIIAEKLPFPELTQYMRGWIKLIEGFK